MNRLIKLSKALRSIGLNDYSNQVLELVKLAIPADITSYPPDSEKGLRSSIGYNAPEVEVNSIKEIMKNSKDHWIIIAVNDIADIDKNILKSEEFKKWIISKNYPADYKIILVGSKPFDFDLDFGNAILHDVFGHSVVTSELPGELPEMLYPGAGEILKTLVNIESPENVYLGNILISNFIVSLHSKIERGVSISQTFEDMIPDIIVGILSKNLTMDRADASAKEVSTLFVKDLNNADMEMIKEELGKEIGEEIGRDYLKSEIEKELKDLVNFIARSIGDWVENLPVFESQKIGNNTVSIVRPW